MDIERTIDDIEQLEEMFEAPDIRTLSANDISAANRRHDEMLAHSPWFQLWQRYGVCCRIESPVLRLGTMETQLFFDLTAKAATLAAPDSDFGFLWICSVRAAAHQGEAQKLVGSVVIGVYPSTDKHRESFTIADETGYVMIPLRPGNYCAEAYGTNGRKLPLDDKTNGGRAICFDIAAHKVAEAALTISHDVDKCDPYSSDTELPTKYGVVSGCSKK